MKKSIIGTIILLAAGSAAAQSSSLTIFGIADLSVGHYTSTSSYYDNSGANSPDGGSKKRSRNAQLSGGIIGFRGTENLGGGLSASFWLESDMTMDDGAKGLGPFNRRSTVSLIGNFGEMRLGRDYTPTFTSDAVYEPTLAAGIGISLPIRTFATLAGLRGPGAPWGDNYVRANNSIGYFLPTNLGGFRANIQYAFPEGTQTTTGQPDDKTVAYKSNRGRYLGTNFGYSQGPLSISFALGESTAADSASLDASNLRKISTRSASASYNFGSIKLMGQLIEVRDRLDSGKLSGGAGASTFSNTSVTDKYKAVQMGAMIPVGTDLIRASYGRIAFKNGAAPTLASGASGNTTSEQFFLGYEYFLSKRTSLYANLVHIRIRNGYNSPVIMGPSIGGLGYDTSGSSAVSGYAPRSATGYNAGVSVRF